MVENFLKTIAEELGFKYDHLNKILTVDLANPFILEYKNGTLRTLGFLPSIKDDVKEQLHLQLMQLNLALQASETLTLGMSLDEKLTLNSDFSFNLNYKQLKNHIESFANHLDKISSMIQDLNKQS